MGDFYLVLGGLKLGDIAVTAGRFFLRTEMLKTPLVGRAVAWSLMGGREP